MTFFKEKLEDKTNEMKKIASRRINKVDPKGGLIHCIG